MFKKMLFVAMASTGVQVQAMEQHQNLSGDPFNYVRENAFQDKRKIAVLAYGSLINVPAPDDRPALKIYGRFQGTGITVPVALSRHSSKGKDNERITAVIDNTLGQDKELYYATSWTQSLPNARNNLAGREGVELKDNKYSLDNIYYMKKLLPNKSKDFNEIVISDTDGWVIRSATDRVILKGEKPKQLAQWADRNEYTALIWASFPPNLGSEKDVAKTLVNSVGINNNRLLNNTKIYVNDLHVQVLANVPKNRLERAISEATTQNLNASDLKRISSGQ